ncbi:MAG TPA: Rpn family recombination-promoting nuclease/putative transposase [Gammaproteobacteria bacterium]|nr:Rpn family recombination-promoting nuclease/putative transposase [Gammaproteobacteria bacterium]
MMLAKFLNPKNDLAFKRIFGTEKNKDILIHFLNDIFGRSTNPIEEVSFLKGSQDPEIVAQRVSVVDLLCHDAEGNRFIIEMQVDSEPGFEKRAQYYAARTYIEQREKGIKFANLKSVTFLAITDFILFPNDKQRYLTHHITLDKETYEQNLKDFSFSFLELPKFKKTKEQLTTLTEKWAYFFKRAMNTTEEELPLIVGSDNIIKRAYDELNRFAWTDEELRAYESIDMKQAAEKAILEGAIEKEKFEIAKKLLILKLSLQDIATATGLSEAEIKKLEHIT